MRRQSSRQAKAAAKARMSGGIPSSSTIQNKKIVFGDDDYDAPSINDDLQHEQNYDGEEDGDDADGNDNNTNITDNDTKEEDDDDDDAVEEVKGTSARKTTQKIRDEERKIARETSIVKKKRKKKNDIVVEQQEEEESDDSSSEEEEDDDDMLTEDFFKQVDTQRANQLQLQKQEKKQHKIQLKKRLGKHTTFVVEDEYKMGGDTPHRTDQTNIEVVPIGGGGGGSDGGESSYNATTAADQERQLLISATLGSAPSKSSTLFARGSLSCGVSKERGSGGRKRKTKNEETWKRSRKTNRLGVGSRPGQAATLFVCKKKKKK